jgi:hypothetical protein
MLQEWSDNSTNIADVNTAFAEKITISPHNRENRSAGHRPGCLPARPSCEHLFFFTPGAGFLMREGSFFPERRFC